MVALLAVRVALDKQINVAWIGYVADGGIGAQNRKPRSGGVGVCEECSCTDGALAILIENSRPVHIYWCVQLSVKPLTASFWGSANRNRLTFLLTSSTLSSVRLWKPIWPVKVRLGDPSSRRSVFGRYLEVV